MLIKFIIESSIHWRGVDQAGRLQQNRHRGSLRALRAILSQSAIVLTKTKREFHFRKRERTAVLLNSFTEELATLLSSGLHLTDGLTLLKHRYTTSSWYNVISEIVMALHAGHTFSSALSQHPTVFTTSYIQLITAAEQTHQLPTILAQLAQQAAFRMRLKNKLKKALMYPLTVLLFTVFISGGLIGFALPQFQKIFENFNATLPAATEWLLSLSAFLQEQKCMLALGSLSIGFILYALYKKSIRFHTLLQTLLLHAPWCGALYRHKMIADWSYTLSLCVKAKLPLPHSLQLAQQSLSSIAVEKACASLPDLIKSGHALHEALSCVTLFDTAELYLIQMGESSHTLENALERLSAHAFLQVERALENLSKWLEPVMMLILALITGGLIISLYLPIFKIGSIL